MLYVVLQALASSYMYHSTYLPSFIVKKKQPQKNPSPLPTSPPGERI